jgi:hypothetical protein
VCGRSFEAVSNGGRHLFINIKWKGEEDAKEDEVWVWEKKEPALIARVPGSLLLHRFIL